MAEEIGWVDLGVRPDVEGFPGDLDRGLSGKLDPVGRNLGRSLGRNLGRAAVGTAALTLGAGYAAFRFGQDAFGEYDEARKGAELTNQLIEQTGGVANVTARGMDRLTSSLMRKTAIDDDTIRTSGNILLTFKQVANAGKGMNAVFDRSVRAATDLSSIKGFGGLEGASKMLGKALNDPEKGLAALGKAGVGFTQDQKDQIAALVETGDLLTAQKIILKEVESQVGGSAAAQATALDKVSASYGEIKESVGEAAYPYVQKFARYMQSDGVPIAERFAGWLGDDGIPAFARTMRRDVIPGVKGFYDEAKPVVKEALPALRDGFEAVRDFAKEAAPFARDVIGAFNDMPDWAKKALIGGAVVGGAGIKLNGAVGGGGGAVGAIVGRGSRVNPMFVRVVGGTPGGNPRDPLVDPTNDEDSKNGKNKRGPGVVAVGGATLATSLAIDSAPSVAQALFAGKNLEIAADEFGFSIDRLREDLQQNGTSGDYVKQVQRLLDSKQSALKDVLFSVNPYVTDNERAGLAEGELDNLIENFDFKPTEKDKRNWARMFSDVPVGVSADTDRADEQVDRIFRGTRTIIVDGNTQALEEKLASVTATINNVRGFFGQAPVGPTINYNGSVTYTDDKEGRRRAQQNQRRAGSDGVRR